MHEEVIVISDTYTIIDPRAMMVPAFDTAVTYTAVVRPWSGQDFAARTDVIWMEILEQMHDLVLLLKVTWIHTLGHEEACNDKYP